MYGKTLADYPGRLELFREALKDLPEAALDFGFNRAIRTLTEFPVPAQILDFAADFYGRPEARIIVHKLEAKPDGWVPVNPSEVKEWTDQALANLDRVKAMDAPPDKTLQQHQAGLALQRLGGSTAPMAVRPTTPGENHAVRPEAFQANRQWAHDMAVKNGWIQERQPGDDDE